MRANQKRKALQILKHQLIFIEFLSYKRGASFN